MPILTLIKAIQKNEVQSIDDLLSSYNKEDLKVTDKAGNSLLHYLIKYGQTEMAEKLFNYYKEFSIAEFTALKNKQSENPLHWLIRYRRDIFVVIPKVFQPQVILAWINQPNAHGNTPLHLAVTLGNSVGIDQLLELGKQNIHINSRNFQGQTSLHIAAQKNMYALLKR
ncbi:MAG: hypothetical protein HWD59_06765 [Coxiellaceae bacterium]|nr:MAG: hypothetical protein HWD59_06765 [Coxiellaceae bacterium]